MKTSLYTRKMVGAPSLAVDAAHTYRISLQRSGEGADAAWLAEVDELPSCNARGATAEEALRRAWAAANEATGLSESTENVVPATGARHSGRLLVRMPATLHDELARAAAMEGVSLNQLITGTLAGAMRWRVPDGNGTAAGTVLISDHADASRSGSGWLSARTIRLALVANAVVLALAAIAAIALVIVALQNG
jgi:predicted HicB family RNase H-like nuclease